MAKKNRVGLQFSGFRELAEKLDELEGDLKKTTENALRGSKAIVSSGLKEAARESNYPAHGKYSRGGTRESIDVSNDVEWSGTLGEIHVGFDFKKSGLKSIFLMYGTPRMKKVQEMYDAVPEY